MKTTLLDLLLRLLSSLLIGSKLDIQCSQIGRHKASVLADRVANISYLLAAQVRRTADSMVAKKTDLGQHWGGLQGLKQTPHPTPSLLGHPHSLAAASEAAHAQPERAALHY